MYVKDTFCETKHNLQKLGIVRQANIAGQLRFEGGTPTSQHIVCKRYFLQKNKTKTKHDLQKLGKVQQANIAFMRVGPPRASLGCANVQCCSSRSV